ncbi:MAG: hypothetical protein GEU79_11845 [Acidimicrobiia bacterium]|nr:hypothetical protein [Acidimicrobiia bacterium]
MTERTRPPIFVGGTGRSGTTILAKAVSAHPSVSLVPIETRFLVDGNGLLDVVADPDRFPAFRERITTTWWKRTSAYGDSRGLHLIIDEGLLENALRALEVAIGEERILDGARQFADEILDTQLSGADTWVEMTPTTVARSADLARLYPDMKLIHIHRDGRDVACSVAKMKWGPSDPFEGLEWWADSLRRAGQGSTGLDRSSLMHVDLEDLVGPARDLVRERILEFLGLEPDCAMVEFWEAEMTGTHAHVDQWLKDIPPEQTEDFRELHRQLVDQLGRDGVVMGGS